MRWLFAFVLGTSCSAAAAFSTSRPIVWSIAGSDSGGGAGVEADLRTMTSLGTHGCSVITALTAQNSLGVTSVLGTDPEHVAKTIETLETDMRPAAVKVGMVCNA